MTHPPGCVTPAEDLFLTQQGGDLFVGNYPVPEFEELRHEFGEVGWICSRNLRALACAEFISRARGIMSGWRRTHQASHKAIDNPLLGEIPVPRVAAECAASPGIVEEVEEIFVVEDILGVHIRVVWNPD